MRRYFPRKAQHTGEAFDLATGFREVRQCYSLIQITVSVTFVSDGNAIK
jgi:hypothetical protein